MKKYRITVEIKIHNEHNLYLLEQKTFIIESGSKDGAITDLCYYFTTKNICNHFITKVEEI